MPYHLTILVQYISFILSAMKSVKMYVSEFILYTYTQVETRTKLNLFSYINLSELHGKKIKCNMSIGTHLLLLYYSLHKK